MLFAPRESLTVAERYLRKAIRYVQPTHPAAIREACEVLLAQIAHAKQAAAPDTLPFPSPGDEGSAPAPRRETLDEPVTRATWERVWATWALVVAGVVYAAFTLGILREQKGNSVARITPILAPRLRRIENYPLANLLTLSQELRTGCCTGR